MEKIQTEEEKIARAVRGIPAIAKREGWVFTYDREEKALFYSPEVISDGSFLHQATDDCDVYLDDEMNPRGIMIEYYEENFLEHHKDIKKISEKLFNGKEVIQVVDPAKKNKRAEVTSFKKLFEEDLLSEIEEQ